MPNDPNFIPADLRPKLETDANEARQKGDRNCEHILRQLAAYHGNDAAQFARDLGAEACIGTGQRSNSWRWSHR